MKERQNPTFAIAVIEDERPQPWVLRREPLLLLQENPSDLKKTETPTLVEVIAAIQKNGGGFIHSLGGEVVVDVPETVRNIEKKP
jgi:hypothetical protein